MKLTVKFYTSILAVTVLALVSSAISLFTTWRMMAILGEMVGDDIPSIREAEKVESSLLKQDEIDESYILDDGNVRWLNALDFRKSIFNRWLSMALSNTHDKEEQDILARLEKEYNAFDAKRLEVFALFDKGDKEKAKEALLNELNPLSNRMGDTCEDFIKYVERHTDNAVARAESRTKYLVWIASIFTGLTAASGLGLLWLFIHGVHAPLKRMAMEAKLFSESAQHHEEIPFDDEFNAVGFYLRAMMTDMASTQSALLKSRQQAKNAEKLASVGKLAACVAHEIRNPLIAVKLWLTSIQKKRKHDIDLDHDLQLVSDEITRLDEMVRDFLEFSRPADLNMEKLDITGLLDETVELVNHRCEDGRISIVREYASPSSPIMGDRKQLKQLFINLLNNAFEAMSDGGEIEIRVDSPSNSDNQPMLTVHVKDSGSGIPEEVQERLFEPFFTTKDGGTGLGLSIAAGIVSRHLGRLVLESSDGRGTSFVVWLPVINEPNDIQQSTSKREEPIFK